MSVIQKNLFYSMFNNIFSLGLQPVIGFIYGYGSSVVGVGGFYNSKQN